MNDLEKNQKELQKDLRELIEKLKNLNSFLENSKKKHSLNGVSFHTSYV